jgi:elongation factor G
MSRKLDKIRNIGVIAHIDAGKTTVTERMLFLSGAKHRVGMVDKGTTTTDDDPEEADRGITIYSACVTFNWADVHVNLIDTPGHVDFTAEVERSLRVLDGAVVVFSAREGVEAQSETVWRQANRYHVPRVAFINKMDREGAGFERVFEEIRTRLQGHPVALFVPVGQGPEHVANPFRGIIDLVQMKMLTFADEGKSVTRAPVPDDLAEYARVWRTRLISDLSNFSDELMMLALEDQPIPETLIHEVVRSAVLGNHIQPVSCGAALHGVGVQTVLDSVARYLPAPSDRPPVKGTRPGEPEKEEVRKPDPSEPFCGLVFKILPAKTGDFYWVRIYSGVLRENTRALCPSKDKKENIAQLWQIHASKKERDGQIAEASAGDIVGVIGPRYAVTGETLCDARLPIELASIQFPETVLEMAIEPETTSDRKKLAETLEMLKRQDPTFKSEENEATGQTLIAGMGELHLEVIKNRLLRDFKLNVKVHKPRVSYRETIARAVEVTGECHRVINGVQLFAKVALRVEPEASREGVLVRSLIGDVPGFLPEFRDAVMEELRSRGEGGGAIGSFPLSGIRITVTGVEVDPVQSSAIAFSIAAADAFEEGLRQGEPLLLEPMMKLVISTPNDYYGEFVSDLAQRRARIVHTDNHAGMTFIEAHAPLAELFGYAGAMRSLSQGRAGSSMEPIGYEPAPAEISRAFAM